MNTILLPLYGALPLMDNICQNMGYTKGEVEIRSFPDEETYMRIISDVNERSVIIFATLDRPNAKILPLIFLAKMARDYGARSVGLIAPYLAYMRQDKVFHPGEGITAQYFARLLSSCFDWMVTVEPHLHRSQSISSLYSIPSFVLHPTASLSHWIEINVKNPLIVGPDKESESSVQKIAQLIKAPSLIFDKNRMGDRKVSVSAPDLSPFKNLTPVIVDDIISTGETIMAVISQLKQTIPQKPYCIAVHGVFSEQCYEALSQLQVAEIVTTNTITHSSNQIDISHQIVQILQDNALSGV